MRCTRRNCDQVCFYCQETLGGDTHEHDHAPTPARHGGEDTVPTCLPCHDRKDRLPMRQWPVDVMVQALEECGPLGRIFLAKSFAIHMDREAEIDRRVAEALTEQLARTG